MSSRWLGQRLGRLLDKDKSGLLLKRMEECVDGEYQDFKSKDRRLCTGAFLREVSGAQGNGRRYEDDEIWRSQARRP